MPVDNASAWSGLHLHLHPHENLGSLYCVFGERGVERQGRGAERCSETRYRIKDLKLTCRNETHALFLSASVGSGLLLGRRQATCTVPFRSVPFRELAESRSLNPSSV